MLLPLCKDSMEEAGRVSTVQEENRKVYKSNSGLDSRIKYKKKKKENTESSKIIRHCNGEKLKSESRKDVFYRFDLCDNSLKLRLKSIFYNSDNYSDCEKLFNFNSTYGRVHIFQQNLEIPLNYQNWSDKGKYFYRLKKIYFLNFFLIMPMVLPGWLGVVGFKSLISLALKMKIKIFLSDLP